ncbi:MAG: zinc-dependent alcohol dehydrogenase, partial [Planctomycetota bacterium]
HCGECAPCQSGHYNRCENIEWHPSHPEGALSEAFCYRAEALFPVPQALTDDQVALVEPTAVAVHALDRAEIATADNIVIIGAGTIGLSAVAIANARDINHVISIAKYAHQADMAAEMGATDVIQHGEADPREVVPELLGRQGADASVDTVAVGTSFSTGIALTRPGGTMVEVGGVTRPLLAALDPLVRREINVRGSSCYAASQGETDFNRAIQLIADGAITPEKLVTHVFALEEVQKAFETADDKESGAIKVVVGE